MQAEQAESRVQRWGGTAQEWSTTPLGRGLYQLLIFFCQCSMLRKLFIGEQHHLFLFFDMLKVNESLSDC